MCCLQMSASAVTVHLLLGFEPSICFNHCDFRLYINNININLISPRMGEVWGSSERQLSPVI